MRIGDRGGEQLVAAADDAQLGRRGRASTRRAARRCRRARCDSSSSRRRPRCARSASRPAVMPSSSWREMKRYVHLELDAEPRRSARARFCAAAHDGAIWPTGHVFTRARLHASPAGPGRARRAARAPAPGTSARTVRHRRRDRARSGRARACSASPSPHGRTSSGLKSSAGAPPASSAPSAARRRRHARRLRERGRELARAPRSSSPAR